MCATTPSLISPSRVADLGFGSFDAWHDMALPWVRALRWPKGVCPAGEVVLLAALPRVTCHHGCTDARLCRWRFGLRGFDAKIESGLLP